MKQRRSHPTFAAIPTAMGKPTIQAKLAGDLKPSASVANTDAVVSGHNESDL